MPKEPSVPRSTSARPDAAGEVETSATARAQEMRERLHARRHADELLAEASTLRGAAAADADLLVAEAESLAEQLLVEAREAADRLTAQAQERADGILARAYFEAEELRVRSAGLLDGAEEDLRRLAPSLEGAVVSVVGVLHLLDELRSGPRAEAPEVEAPEIQAPEFEAPEFEAAEFEAAEFEAPESETPEAEAPGVSELTGSAAAADEESRPLGWLFRSTHP